MNAIPDPFQLFHLYERLLLTQHLREFVGFALPLYTLFATIALVWFFVRAAAADGGFGTDALLQMVATVAVGFTIVLYYDTNFPGTSYSLTSLIVKQTDWMAERLGTQIQREMFSTGKQILEKPPIPLGLPGVLEIPVYVISLLSVAFVLAAAYAVIALGPIAEALAILVGPFFLPFFIFPKLEGLFYNWLRFFLQASFLKVTAAAVVSIVGGAYLFFLRWMTSWPGGTVAGYAVMPLLILWSLFCAFLIVRIPTLNAQLFSGGGIGTLGFAEGVAVGGAALVIKGGQMAATKSK